MDKRYLAGILDGEGSIEIHRAKGRSRVPYNYNVRVRISNTNRGLLCLVQPEYGGVIGKRSRPGRRVDYLLEISSRNAIRLLKDTLPFLIVKRDQAALALKLPRVAVGQKMSPDIQQKQQDIYKRMQLLNKKGFRAEQLKMEVETKSQPALFDF